MTTIALSNGPLGSEILKIRCDLSQASALVQVDYGTGDGWEPTQYQCADARHRTSELAAIGQRLADKATQTSGEACDWEEVDGVQHELCQVGPDFCILRQPIPGGFVVTNDIQAELIIEVDGDRRGVAVLFRGVTDYPDKLHYRTQAG